MLRPPRAALLHEPALYHNIELDGVLLRLCGLGVWGHHSQTMSVPDTRQASPFSSPSVALYNI